MRLNRNCRAEPLHAIPPKCLSDNAALTFAFVSVSAHAAESRAAVPPSVAILIFVLPGRFNLTPFPRRTGSSSP